jgi:hypothetical protein
MASRNTLAEIIHPRRFAMQASYVCLWRMPLKNSAFQRYGPVSPFLMAE